MTEILNIDQYKKMVKKGRAKPVQKEADLQTQCVNFFKQKYPKYIIHHSANGGKRNVREAVKFKKMGLLAGFPDIIIIIPDCIFFVELKADSKCKATTNQIEVMQKITHLGFRCYLISSLESFKLLIEKYLL